MTRIIVVVVSLGDYLYMCVCAGDRGCGCLGSISTTRRSTVVFVLAVVVILFVLVSLPSSFFNQKKRNQSVSVPSTSYCNCFLQ